MLYELTWKQGGSGGDKGTRSHDSELLRQSPVQSLARAHREAALLARSRESTSTRARLSRAQSGRTRDRSKGGEAMSEQPNIVPFGKYERGRSIEEVLVLAQAPQRPDCKSDLRTKEAEISALREGVLSGRANRQALLDKRRLEAVEKIWASVIALGPAKVVSAKMSIINYDVVAKRISTDPKLREAMELLLPSTDAYV